MPFTFWCIIRDPQHAVHFLAGPVSQEVTVVSAVRESVIPVLSVKAFVAGFPPVSFFKFVLFIWRSVPTSLDVFVEKVLLPGSKNVGVIIVGWSFTQHRQRGARGAGRDRITENLPFFSNSKMLLVRTCIDSYEQDRVKSVKWAKWHLVHSL